MTEKSYWNREIGRGWMLDMIWVHTVWKSVIPEGADIDKRISAILWDQDDDKEYRVVLQLYQYGGPLNFGVTHPDTGEIISNISPEWIDGMRTDERTGLLYVSYNDLREGKLHPVVPDKYKQQLILRRD